MANELYRTYEVLVEESVHTDHPKRATDKTKKPSVFNAEIDGALRDTHMIFQDAVCYNTLCFAGLAGLEVHQSGDREGELLNPLWKHLTTPAAQGGIKEETERMIRRLATHYKPLEGIKTADEFLNRVYSEPLQIRDDMIEPEKAQVWQLRVQCYRILENGARDKKTGELSCENLSPFSNTWSGVICVGGDATIPGNLPYDRISRELKPKITDGQNDADVNAIIKDTLLTYRTLAQAESSTACETAFRERLEELQERASVIDVLPDTEKTKAKKLQKAKAKVEEHLAQKEKFQENFFTELREALPKDGVSATAKRFASKEAKELELTEAEFVAVQTTAASAKPETKQFFRLREQKVGRTNAFEEAMFRYWLLHDNGDQLVKKAAVREFRRFIERDVPEREPKMDDGTPILQMPFRDKAPVAFHFFGKTCLEILKPDSVRSSPHRELDVAAFKAAIEDVFKYKIRTDDRAQKVARLFNIVDAYEGSGLDAEHSPTKNPIRGMKDDARWNSEDEKRKGIVQLLREMSSEKKIGSYGLRAGTIGGWAEVRKMFLRRHKQCSGRGKRMAALPDWLERGVDKEQTANRQGFGSADFFHELCDPVYFHLWLSGSEFEHGGIKDFIPHYVSYCEWREELISLLTKDGVELERETELPSAELKKLANKPIRYTWPGLLNRHKKPSYRYYDFSENLNVALELKSLFRRVRPTDAPHGFPTYEPRKDDKSKLTLAARRLKRDKIVNKNGSSVDSLWCPPLILEGESNPTAANKPKAGKEKKKASDPAEVSFSLIASPLPGDSRHRPNR